MRKYWQINEISSQLRVKICNKSETTNHFAMFIHLSNFILLMSSNICCVMC